MQRQDSRPYIRKIEFVFYREAEIREAVAMAREDAAEISPHNGSGIPDPTAYEAVRNLSPIPYIFIEGVKLEHPELWLLVVEKTYNWCKKQRGCHYDVAQLRYSKVFYRSICWKLSISENVLYQTIEKIRIYAALQAAQLHLIFVE